MPKYQRACPPNGGGGSGYPSGGGSSQGGNSYGGSRGSQSTSNSYANGSSATKYSSGLRQDQVHLNYKQLRNGKKVVPLFKFRRP